MATAWLPVPGYPMYAVSDTGEVWSYYVNRVLKQAVDSLGYHDVYLSTQGKTVAKSVHRLVMTAFEGESDLTDIRHLNGNPSDNRLSNLAYGTRSENMMDAVHHGTHYWSSRSHCKNGHEFTSENTGPRKSGRRCRACKRISERNSRTSKKVGVL